jgi:hypothetical protein
VSPPAITYQGVLVPAPELATPLGYPLAVTLHDGRVLIVDNSGRTALLAEEVFNPATGEHVPTGPLSTGSLGFSAVAVLRDGRVLLVGSAQAPDAPAFGVAEIFDPGTLRFTAAGPMITPRAGAKLAMLPDGRVLIAGGTPPDDPNTALASGEIFDPSTRTFKATGSMSTPRSFHAMTSLADGRVLVVGGETTYTATGSSLSSAEVYDPGTGTFSDAGSMSMIAGTMSYLTGVSLAVTLPDGRALVFGQTTPPNDVTTGLAEVWDPATSTFSALAGPPDQVATATLVDDGRVFLTGGSGMAGRWAGIYDPQTGQTQMIDPPHAVDATATRLADGRVLLVGGHGKPQPDGNSGPWLATMEIFQ